MLYACVCVSDLAGALFFRVRVMLRHLLVPCRSITCLSRTLRSGLPISMSRTTSLLTSQSSIAIALVRAGPTYLLIGTTPLHFVILPVPSLHFTSYLGNAALLSGYVARVAFEHNEIADPPNTGISMGWGWSRTPAGPSFNNTIFANYVHGSNWL